MGMRDTVLTPMSKISLAAASHLFVRRFRKPSDAAFTATLSSGEHAIATLLLDNLTGHLVKLERWVSPRDEDTFSLSPLLWLC